MSKSVVERLDDRVRRHQRQREVAVRPDDGLRDRGARGHGAVPRVAGQKASETVFVSLLTLYTVNKTLFDAI